MILDHIVYTVANLETAIETFQKKTGIRPVFGGYHKTQGTKNALVNLKSNSYLEFLAADDSNEDVLRPRWMGIDYLTKNQITRFALRSDNLEDTSKLLKMYNPNMGCVTDGSRVVAVEKTLKWKLTMPLPSPEVDIIPFLIDWSESEVHPTKVLSEPVCEIIDFYATHPKPEKINQVFQQLKYPMNIKTTNEVSLKLTLRTPNGIIQL